MHIKDEGILLQLRVSFLSIGRLLFWRPRPLDERLRGAEEEDQLGKQVLLEL